MLLLSVSVGVLSSASIYDLHSVTKGQRSPAQCRQGAPPTSPRGHPITPAQPPPLLLFLSLQLAD